MVPEHRTRLVSAGDRQVSGETEAAPAVDNAPLRQQIADYLTASFVAPIEQLPADECLDEADHILALIAATGGAPTPQQVNDAAHEYTEQERFQYRQFVEKLGIQGHYSNGYRDGSTARGLADQVKNENFDTFKLRLAAAESTEVAQ
jgi:hypothetical protein